MKPIIFTLLIELCGNVCWGMLPVGDAAPTEEEKKVAQGMESMFVNLMIREMRKSVPENEFMPPTQAERIYTEMLDQEYSQKIVEYGSVGFADLILAQIRGKR